MTRVPISLTLDLKSATPAYRQIALRIQEQVQKGRLLPGLQMPTVRELAARLGVHFNTVARAYRILDSEQVLSAQHGRGTFIVRAPATPACQRARRAALDSLVKRMFTDAARQGFSAQEVLSAAQARAKKKSNVSRETERSLP